MGQILVRNVSDQALSALKLKAKAKGNSLEQEVRNLIEANAPYSPQERLMASRQVREPQQDVAPAFTLEEIREGLE